MERVVGGKHPQGLRRETEHVDCALDGEVRFASAADRAAFAEELAASVTVLVRKYHDGTATRGRDHRVVVAIHPSVARATLKTDKKES